MKTLLVLCATTLAITGCAATETPQEPQTVQMRENLSEEDHRQLVPGPNPQSGSTSEDPVKSVGEDAIEVVQLFEGQTYIAGTGLQVTLISRAPTSKGLDIEVRFSRGDESFDVFQQGNPAYHEGSAFGTLYSVSATTSQTLLTLHGKAPDAPIDVSTAARVASPVLNERPDCRGAERVSALGDTNGTIEIRAVKGEQPRLQIVCAIRVGLYTRQVITQ